MGGTPWLFKFLMINFSLISKKTITFAREIIFHFSFFTFNCFSSWV